MVPKFIFFMLFSLFTTLASSQSGSPDAPVMADLQKSLNPPKELGWGDPDPCQWKNVQCSDGRVTRIQMGHQNLGGTLPLNLNKLNSLQVLELQDNQISGPLPSLSGLNSLTSLLLSNNNFSSVPNDFFNGMTALTSVYLDYNPFSVWSIPQGLINSSSLQTFSATSTNLTGLLPDFLTGNNFPSLASLHLSFNSLEGPIPSSFSGSAIQSLWLNGQRSFSKLNGSLAVLGNMTELSEVWLHGNSFTGPLPDFTRLGQLQSFSVRDNLLTGPVPDSLVNLKSLMVLNLTNNYLQGEIPVFNSSVKVDIGGRNRFCVTDPGKECDPRVNILLNVVRDFGYPSVLAEDWSGNNPCSPPRWRGITCDVGGYNITVVNLASLQLNGTISANFSEIISLQKLILSGNRLTGKIPPELTSLPSLVELDVSNNQLHGVVPSFRSTVNVKTTGNVDIGKEDSSTTDGGGNADSTGSGNGGENKKNTAGIVVGSIFGVLVSVGVVGGLVFYFSKRKRSNRVQSPHHMILHPPSESNDAIKISIANSSLNGGISETHSHGNSGPSDLHIVEAGNLVISIQVLRNVTNNFSEHNILGRGGFGTVYKGELHDGTKIAVKRMESGVMSEKGLDEFKSEISVLTKVRHRHLVALLGYCLDGNERLLVYEYMPQGTLSRYLFDWEEEGLKPLEWMKRLTIALDVARGVEYLHGLAQQSFIHRDLKPSNILLGDDLRAKVADFGLVRLADGKASIATKLAGTFGYLAPEYAVTGRVSTKIDVYSFGVILMEIITGRKALDESKPDDSQHLVPWFRRMLINKETFHKAIDPTLDILNEETLASINTVSELAGHCSVREPYQRPDMGHVVNVLSSLAELWKPSDPVDPEDLYGIDYDMTLPQAVKKWQALEGRTGDCSSSSFMGSNDNTQTSIPTRPSGFANSFASSDGR